MSIGRGGRAANQCLLHSRRRFKCLADVSPLQADGNQSTRIPSDGHAWRGQGSSKHPGSALLLGYKPGPGREPAGSEGPGGNTDWVRKGTGQGKGRHPSLLGGGGGEDTCRQPAHASSSSLFPLLKTSPRLGEDYLPRIIFISISELLFIKVYLF